MIHGVINIHKEKGYTSHDVVAKLRGIVGQKKIGHTGTLDPDATGVLPVCFGKATKNQQSNTSWLNNSHKAYLPMSAANGAASYSFRFPGTTAIENVEVENEVKAIYDLAGRRVENVTAPGIYIVNGVKRVVR